MAKLQSLADLAGLLPEDWAKAQNAAQSTRDGYDGKPQRVKVVTEKRANKIVTLARGFQSNPAELERLAHALKKRCGAGGRALDNEIELQGDHAAKVRTFLSEEGYKVQ